MRLYAINNLLCGDACRLGNGYPVSSGLYRKADAVLIALRKLRSALDNQVLNDYPELDRQAFMDIYYPGPEESGGQKVLRQTGEAVLMVSDDPEVERRVKLIKDGIPLHQAGRKVAVTHVTDQAVKIEQEVG